MSVPFVSGELNGGLSSPPLILRDKPNLHGKRIISFFLVFTFFPFAFLLALDYYLSEGDTRFATRIFGLFLSRTTFISINCVRNCHFFIMVFFGTPDGELRLRNCF